MPCIPGLAFPFQVPVGIRKHGTTNTELELLDINFAIV